MNSWISLIGNKALANDDLLSLFTTSRKVANGSQYPFRLPMVPMAANGTNGKITFGTTGKTLYTHGLELGITA